MPEGSRGQELIGHVRLGKRHRPSYVEGVVSEVFFAASIASLLRQHGRGKGEVVVVRDVPDGIHAGAKFLAAMYVMSVWTACSFAMIASL